MQRHSELVELKRVPLQISRLGIGTGPLGGLFQSVDENVGREMVEAALDADIVWYDTAPQYGYGLAEKRLGKVLAATNKPYVLESKVGRLLRHTEVPNPTPWYPEADPHIEAVYDYSTDAIARSIHESLERLGVQSIDIALIHDAEDHVQDAIESAYPALATLKAQGLIKAIGLGMNFCKPALEIMKNTELDIVHIAGRFTLLDQEAQHELFPYALEHKIDITSGGVFNSGVLANPVAGATYNYMPAPNEIIARAQKVGQFLKERGVSVTAAALQFPLRHPAVAGVLTGTRTKEELLSNIADFDRELPEGIWSELEDAGLIEKIQT